PYGASDVRLYNLAVVRDNIPPRLDLACPAGPATVGTMLDVSLRATDDSGRVIFDVTVAGVPVAMSASGPGVFTGTTQLTQLGNNEILVVARDRAGNVTTNRCSIFVGDELPPGTAPIAEITSPTNDAVVTGPIDIMGTAFDPTLTNYVLTLLS